MVMIRVIKTLIVTDKSGGFFMLLVMKMKMKARGKYIDVGNM